MEFKYNRTQHFSSFLDIYSTNYTNDNITDDDVEIIKEWINEKGKEINIKTIKMAIIENRLTKYSEYASFIYVKITNKELPNLNSFVKLNDGRVLNKTIKDCLLDMMTKVSNAYYANGTFRSFFSQQYLVHKFADELSTKNILSQETIDVLSKLKELIKKPNTIKNQHMNEKYDKLSTDHNLNFNLE